MEEKTNDRCLNVGILRGGRWETKLDIQRRVYSPDGCCPTITASSMNMDYVPTIGERVMEIRIRKLTSKECFRLQGFSDEDHRKAAEVESESQLYKRAGNSICVPVLEALISQLKPYLTE